jgi:hypothetical protein
MSDKGLKNWGSKREVLNPILHLLGSKICVFMVQYAAVEFQETL